MALFAVGGCGAKTDAEPRAEAGGEKATAPLIDVSAGKTGAPLFEAEGWLNGPPPTAADVAGKVVVVDVHAEWCVPCQMLAPGLVQLHEKYTARGVVFIGLSGDAGGANVAADLERFNKNFGVPWPVGYGAAKTIKTLQDSISTIDYPSLYVLARDGKLAWKRVAATFPRDDLPALEAAIEAALAP